MCSVFSCDVHVRQVAYAKVQHWTRNVDLFSKKFVLVPVVEDMHWSLAVLTNLHKLKVRFVVAAAAAAVVVEVVV